MVEVFKTNIKDKTIAKSVQNMMVYYFPFYNVNFDLQDIDHIMRVQSKTSSIDPGPIMRMMRIMGFEAQVLEDKVLGV